MTTHPVIFAYLKTLEFIKLVENGKTLAIIFQMGQEVHYKAATDVELHGQVDQTNTPTFFLLKRTLQANGQDITCL